MPFKGVGKEGLGITGLGGQLSHWPDPTLHTGLGALILYKGHPGGGLKPEMSVRSEPLEPDPVSTGVGMDA